MVELFGSIGLLYIMFVAGVEIDLGTVRDHKNESATFGIFAFVTTFAPATAVGLVMGLDPAGAVLLGAALSSHTLVSYPTINQLGLAKHRPIVAATGGTLLTDTAALIVLVMVIQLADGEGGLLVALGPLLLLGILAALSLVVIPRVADRLMISKTNTPAEKVLAALVILLLLSLIADLIGTEDILGAFLAGLCLNAALHRHVRVREQVEFVGRLLFIPFFFVDTGMRLDLNVFVEGTDVWFLAFALLGVIIVGKMAAAWGAGWMYGYAMRDRIVMAGLSFPQAAATLAVIVVGMELGLVDATTADAVIIVIFATCLIGPLVTGASARRILIARQQKSKDIGSRP